MAGSGSRVGLDRVSLANGEAGSLPVEVLDELSQRIAERTQHGNHAPPASGTREAAAPPPPHEHTPEQHEAALARCDGMIAWYEQHVVQSRRWYRLFSTATIVLSGLTPILILWPQPPGAAVHPLIQAAPAALAALFATLVANYRWREDWIRYAVAGETLRSEKTKFLTRTTQDYALALPRSEAFDNFVYRMESLAISEVSEWRNQLAQKTNEPAAGKGAAA